MHSIRIWARSLPIEALGHRLPFAVEVTAVSENLALQLPSAKTQTTECRVGYSPTAILPRCPETPRRLPDDCSGGRFGSPRPCSPMAACGIAHDAIARCIGTNGIAPKTLRRHFHHEFDASLTLVGTQVIA